MSRSRRKIEMIQVPRSLLLSKDLTPAAKFLWIRLRFDELNRQHYPHRPRLLVKRTCLARSTVYEVLRQAEITGWVTSYIDPATGKRRWKAAYPVRDSGGQRGSVRIPVALIRAAYKLRPQAILAYGLLQLTPDFNGRTGTFKWADLCALTGLDSRTIKRAVRELSEAHWITTSQQNRKAPIWFRIQHADEACKEEIRKYMESSPYRGEAWMRSCLSLTIDTKECEDGARPEFLINPATGERMELDRYYPVHRVAFEFNGRQHYVATGRFTKQEVAAQRKRDRIKRRICKEKNIDLVVVHAEDLSLTGILKKVGTLLPRKALRGFRQTIRYLNDLGARYQLAAESG